MMSQNPATSKQIQPILDLLAKQQFYLKIDLIQTAYTCQDSIVVYHLLEYDSTIIPITECKANKNSSILSISIALSAQEISVQLVLPGLLTVGGIRLGLTGLSATIDDGR